MACGQGDREFEERVEVVTMSSEHVPGWFQVRCRSWQPELGLAGPFYGRRQKINVAGVSDNLAYEHWRAPESRIVSRQILLHFVERARSSGYVTMRIVSN